MPEFISHNGLIINRDFHEFLMQNNLADLQSLENYSAGEIVKEKRSRIIIRIEKQGKTFFLKKHSLTWMERIRSIIPWMQREDARNEWQNIILLHNLGFHTMTPVAFGEKLKAGLPCLSLTLTESLNDAEKLETYLPKHFSPPLGNKELAQKRELIKSIGDLLQDLHMKGLNHQDFYLGHLFIRPADNTLFIIDLQRMHAKKSVCRHDMIKDIAQVIYSGYTLKIFSKTDLMRFVHVYFRTIQLNKEQKDLLRKILSKAAKIARHDAKLLLRKAGQKA